MEERTGEAFELGEQLTVVGSKLKPGDMAPDFLLDFVDPDTSEASSVTLADSVGKVRLLNVINSLDTTVCHVETRKWDVLRAQLPENVVVYTVSMDLPYAQARWSKSEGVSHRSLSAHKSEKFGQDYGTLIKEWRLLQRAVFVIDPGGRVIYAEYVPDQMREPDYKAAVDAATQAAGVQQAP